MELLCPECLGELTTSDGRTARCTTHGGQYQILFCRAAPEAENRASDGETILAGVAGDPPPPAGMGVPCTNHPEIGAVHRCLTCGAPICGTCAFKFPGAVVVCPACAASPKSTFSPKRRNYLVASFVCAALATAFMAAVFAGAFAGTVHNESDAEALGMLMMVVILGTTIPGIALAVSARPPGRPAPLAVWVASIWNIAMLAGWLLLCLIGNLR